jgi:hypothetical protein
VNIKIIMKTKTKKKISAVLSNFRKFGKGYTSGQKSNDYSYGGDFGGFGDSSYNFGGGSGIDNSSFFGGGESPVRKTVKRKAPKVRTRIVYRTRRRYYR